MKVLPFFEFDMSKKGSGEQQSSQFFLLTLLGRDNISHPKAFLKMIGGICIRFLQDNRRYKTMQSSKGPKVGHKPPHHPSEASEGQGTETYCLSLPGGPGSFDWEECTEVTLPETNKAIHST